MAIDIQAQAHVLAAFVLADGDARKAIDIIEGFAGYADKPGLSYTLRAVARLARRYVETQNAAAAGD